MHRKKGDHQAQKGKGLYQQQECIWVGEKLLDISGLNRSCPLNLDMKKSNHDYTGFDKKKPVAPNNQSQQQCSGYTKKPV
jgi:hypothetical protein